jgi:hypothetical protein
VSSSFAVDYRPRTVEPESEQRFPPRYRLPGCPPGQDYESLTAKHGRPVGPFEKDRHHSYRASGSSIVASSAEVPEPWWHL